MQADVWYLTVISLEQTNDNIHHVVIVFTLLPFGLYMVQLLYNIDGPQHD